MYHISPVKIGYVDVPDDPEYDPEKCQALLAEAGYPGGQGLPELEYITSVGFYPKTREYGELIAAMLQEQGFPVKLTICAGLTRGDSGRAAEGICPCRAYPWRERSAHHGAPYRAVDPAAHRLCRRA